MAMAINCNTATRFSNNLKIRPAKSICSIYSQANLVKQNPENEKDVVRMLELAPNCHRFDSVPPLEEDDLVSSTDKFDRKKRRQLAVLFK
ncbi:hypothetical protein ANCDUO_04036 [Ancylostoma duodenale]|uniref:Uncharacterized protein n=1 Tax=Ancylostoma duodenale TaxID=51022 RepID=A0A0C2H226_9BILA|nr:hypothetical protein ANCDUO_04036 [Ancylostoma duodenale]